MLISGFRQTAPGDLRIPYDQLLRRALSVAAKHSHQKTALHFIGLLPQKVWSLSKVHVQLQVGSILNFSLMYFLAPTATVAGGAAAGGLVQRLLGDHYLRKWGAPAGHLFEPGFPLSKRLVNFAYKVTAGPYCT